jgi:hypothetical protein
VPAAHKIERGIKTTLFGGVWGGEAAPDLPSDESLTAKEKQPITSIGDLPRLYSDSAHAPPPIS